MRLFLDVGAHNGQTLEVAVRPKFRFDRLFAFEPMPAQFATLKAAFGRYPQVELFNFGLSNRAGEIPMYGTNATFEASLFRAGHIDQTASTRCQFVAASDFFGKHVPADATVIAKLNCEGSEVDILDDLAATGEIWKLDNVMIDFDVRRIQGMEARERQTLDTLAAIGFDRFSLAEDVMVGETHAIRTDHWLTGVT